MGKRVPRINDRVPEPMPRRGRGGTPLKAGVGVLQTCDCPVFYTPEARGLGGLYVFFRGSKN